MSLVKLPRMSGKEIELLLQGQMICRIAFRGEDCPYIAPFQYIYHNNTLYFHFTNYGRKMRHLQSSEAVCIEVEEYEPNFNKFKFVVLTGKLSVVEDPEEKAVTVKKMSQQGSVRMSENFLTAHGLRKEDGWSSLIGRKDLTMVKLVDVRERIGLKSP